MRLWGFVLFEGLVLGGIGVGLFFGVHQVRRALSGGDAALHGSLRTPRDRLSERTGGSELDPVPIDVATDATGTFHGVKDELLLERMRSAELVQVKPNKGGSSLSFRFDFADGSHAAFKPEQTNPQTVPRKEVAAYRLNRWLGLHSVPPATMRTFHRDELLGKLVPEAQFAVRRIEAETIFDAEGFTKGELSYWIPVIVDSHLDAPDSLARWSQWLTVGQPIPPDQVGMMAQLSSLLVFDLLINNSDRFSGGNLMMSRDGRVLYWMDNAFGFQLEPHGHLACRTQLAHCQKFSRKLVAALRRLDHAALRRALAADPGILSEAEMAAVLGRKSVALRYIDRLIAQFGAERVLAFP